MISTAKKITNQILNDAKKQAESLTSNAEKTGETLIIKQKELALKDSRKKVYEILEKGKNRADEIKRTIVADAKKKANWKLLSEKEHLVNLVLKNAKIRLKSFSETENYIAFLKNLITKSAILLGSGKVEIILNKRDSKLKLNLENSIYKETGLETKLYVSNENIEKSFGCIVKRYDGKIVIDNTFTAILNRLEKDLKLKIAKILFS